MHRARRAGAARRARAAAAGGSHQELPGLVVQVLGPLPGQISRAKNVCPKGPTPRRINDQDRVVTTAELNNVAERRVMRSGLLPEPLEAAFPSQEPVTKARQAEELVGCVEVLVSR